jgi:hypothetical protein
LNIHAVRLRNIVSLSIIAFFGFSSGCGNGASPDCALPAVACTDSRCHNLGNDPSNCGQCGNSCPAGEVCSGGACYSRCANGITDCSGSCVDLGTDANNCGACGTICTNASGAPKCVGGVCAVAASACDPGSFSSGGACQACAAACGANQYETTACTPTTDRACGSCGAGFYLSGNVCIACSGACPAGRNLVAACSATADRACAAAADCYALHAAYPLLTDGPYALDPDGPGGADPFLAYCDMTLGGGGWTLLMKIDGTQPTFSYASPYWTNGTTYQPTQFAYDTVNETKLDGFNSMPLNAMRIGMYDPTDQNTRWLEIPRVNSSLVELFTSGYQATSFGREVWEGLLSSPSLQPNCNAEGFNVALATTNARIGIVSNQENDCNSPDSRIGIGTAGGNCGQNTASSAGDEAYCTPDHGDRSTSTFGYVMIRDCPGGVCQCGTLTSCNSICVDISTNRQACGSCTNACGSQNAVGTCTAGVCTEVCNSGFSDCDNNPTTGCEANLDSDTANCGSCGIPCAVHQFCDVGICTDLPSLTIVDPNGATVEYLPRSEDNYLDPAEGTCSTDCVVYPTIGNRGGVRLRAPNGFASGCDQGQNRFGQCYVSLPGTVVLN